MLVEGAEEEDLTIHFWDGSGWQALDTLRSPYYNMASALSQGAGVYALLAEKTTPVIEAYTPSVTTEDVTTTLTITGSNFLAPVKVVLVDSDTYTLSAHLVNSATITAEIPAYYLPAQEYEMKVVNGDQGEATVTGTLGVFTSADACFYDFFESGANKWQRDEDWDWGIVFITPTQELAMTDSPIGPYKNADDYGSGFITYTTSITSQAFDLTHCTNPTLTLRHDYVLAKIGESQDVARVEISTDDGATWTELARYSGGGIFGEDLGAQVESPEWANATWKEVEIGLADYTGMARLRFSLEVNDDAAASKGWVIDDVMVKSEMTNTILLPIILKQE